MSDISVHLFPLSVEFEGSIKTKKHLKLEKNGDEYETMITGRKLLGHPVRIQGKTQAQVWKKQVVYKDEQEEEEDDNDEEEEPCYEWKKTPVCFNEFIFWRKDTKPDKEDARLKAIEHWLDISQTIHEPIPL